MSPAAPRTAIARLLNVLLLFVAMSASGTVSGAGVPVQTVDGEPGDLVDFLSEDKWTVVAIWTTYCGICEEQYPMLSAFHRDHAEEDAVVLGLSLDGYGKGELVAKHQAEHAHAFPSVLSEADAFTVPYQLTTGTEFSGTPTYILFDRDRRLRAFLNDVITREAIEAFIADDQAPVSAP